MLVLLTKADKLASGARKAQVNMVREAVLAFNGDVQVEPFSSLKKQGVDKLRQKLDTWFNELTRDGSGRNRRINPRRGDGRAFFARKFLCRNKKRPSHY